VLRSKQIDAARDEIERVTELVNSGALPRMRLQEAEDKLADAQDDAILAQTLYGDLPADHLSEQMAADMVAAAQRRVERESARLAQMQKMVDDGIATVPALGPYQDELNVRRMNLSLARTRARLIGELASILRYEKSMEALQSVTRVEPYTDYTFKSMAHFDGSSSFNEAKDLVILQIAFEKKFAHPLPVSADGQTAVHEALGFNHRGRVDVAVNPYDQEGIWLRHYLEARGIPYYAFSRAIPGKATGAHIHIGPGSTRLHNAD
jgi:hypothetical protein